LARPLALVLLALAALASAGCSESDRRPAQPSTRESIYGVQLHVHGSMSEGHASMRGHNAAARELGDVVDVIWWSDHDWRLAGHTYVKDFGFEQGLSEVEPAPAPLRAPQWDGREPLPTWHAAGDFGPDAPPESVELVEKVWTLREQTPGARARISDREARDGTQSLQLSVRSEAGRSERVVLVFEASRRRHIASLASEVKLGLSVLPVHFSGDARMVLSARLSNQPPNLRSRLDYVLTQATLGAKKTEARIGRVEGQPGRRALQLARIEVPAEPGLWNDWVFDLTSDATDRALGGEDNSVVEIVLRAEVRGAGRLDVYVDDLRIQRDVTGENLFHRERQLAAQMGEGGIVNHVGQEISYAAHLNAFGPDVPLADPIAHPHGLTPDEAVAFVHDHGGIVSLNHVFGVQVDRRSHRFPNAREAFEAGLARLIADRAHGVDLLEVGYRSRGHGLDGFVELWDRLALAGIRLTGIGTSDSHDEDVGWARGPNNFITWIFARSDRQVDLMDGLRSGRAFFGDPTRFDGALDIAGPAGSRMGDLVFVPKGEHPVRFDVVGLRAGQRVRWILDGQVRRAPPVGGKDFSHEETIDVQSATFVRFEVLEGDEVIVLSNPLYLAPQGSPRPPEGSRTTRVESVD
jgi:hypothetical protein